MSRDDILAALRDTGKPMTLKELVRHTGLAPSTVATQCQKLFKKGEVSRRYWPNEGYRSYVYYFLGERPSYKQSETMKVELAWRTL